MWWDFIRRWHPVILLVVGLYIAIPKPAPNPAEIDSEFLSNYDKNSDGAIDKSEFTGFDFADRDVNGDGLLTTGSMFRWPLHEFKMNLGQDLKGGSSLRYSLIQQDVVDAERALAELFEPLRDNLERLSPEARAKFSAVILGGQMRLGQFNLRANESTEADDFNLLVTPGVFDEGRADATRRHYRAWQEGRQRADQQNLVGPTIETLNRRLNATGMTELSIAPLGDSGIEVKLPSFSTPAETQRFKDLLETTGRLEMRVLAPEDGAFADLEVGQYPRDEDYKYRWLEVEGDRVSSRLAKDQDGRKYVPVMVIDDYNITGKDLSDIQPTMDQQGQMAVSFSLKGQAVARFENLTSIHREGGEDERLLAVIIDDKVYSAYSIKDKITGSVQLSGRFTAAERDDIINVLKSGSLNVMLQLEGEESVGPSEGAEAVQRGFWSFLIAALFVFAFAVWLYRGLGLLVIFNLITIVILILGAMAAGLGTLTLPGIAGLVLTFGMAIDGNILINERMREEIRRGLSGRGAAEEGFKNALPAILDSNITTLLVALILYKVGSGPVQGFALSVAIGIVATLYCNVPAYRAMVMGALSIRPNLRFGMADLSWLENRNIDFVKGMKFIVPIGAVLALTGFILLYSLGSSVLGMEFRGGHTFRVQLSEPTDRETIESRLWDNETNQPKVDWVERYEIQPVYSLGETVEAGKARRFDFRFPLHDAWAGRDPNTVNQELRRQLQETFADTIAPAGWRPRTIDVREVTLEARLRLRLKDPQAFFEKYPDDKEKLWLIQDRAWARDANAPVTNKDRWFGDIVRGSDNAKVVPLLQTSEAGDRQDYTLRLERINVTSAEELNNRINAFRDAVSTYFWSTSENVVLDGEPVFRDVASRGRLEVGITFTQPVSVEAFTALAKDLPAAADPLRPLTFTISPTGDRSSTPTFTLTSGETTFSPETTATDSFDAISAALNTAVVDWLRTAEPAGVELSNPFPLASAIGPTVAGETQVRALLAIVAALVVMGLYMRVRFASLAWGIAATVALLFTTLVTVSLLGLADILGADMKIDLVVVAGILTVIGYALNDVIVNFDRIREILRKDRLATGGTTPLYKIINTSANLMLPRTLMTGGTTLTSTLIMIFLGGPLLSAFAFTIFSGVIIGTFSSVFIAAPVLLAFEKRGREQLLDLTEEEVEQDEVVADAAQGSEEPEPDQPDQGDAGEERK